MTPLTISETFAPVIFQLVIGGVGGFFVGYALRKILKVALILVAIVFSLIFLAYLNVIDVDYDGISELALNFVNAINPALNMLTPLLTHIPFIASFIIGLIIGLRRD